jgi:hypothetical protein
MLSVKLFTLFAASVAVVVSATGFAQHDDPAAGAFTAANKAMMAGDPGRRGAGKGGRVDEGVAGEAAAIGGGQPPIGSTTPIP